MPSSACSSPTEFYPLSLHDALPISDAAAIATTKSFVQMFEVRLPTTIYVRATQSEVTVIHRAGNKVELSANLRASFGWELVAEQDEDRKSTRLNSSHVRISYAVFCLLLAHRVLPSFPTRRSSDLGCGCHRYHQKLCADVRGALAHHDLCAGDPERSDRDPSRREQG